MRERAFPLHILVEADWFCTAHQVGAKPIWGNLRETTPELIAEWSQGFGVFLLGNQQCNDVKLTYKVPVTGHSFATDKHPAL